MAVVDQRKRGRPKRRWRDCDRGDMAVVKKTHGGNSGGGWWRGSVEATNKHRLSKQWGIKPARRGR